MIQAWQKRLLNNRPSVQYDFTTSGTHTQVLDAGIYDISLVGGGGGGALVSVASTGVKQYARGGVGGVIQVRVAVPVQTTVTINVGTGGTSARAGFTGSATNATGVNGGTTNITGLDNAILSAGGGSAASVTATSQTAANRTPGVQGENTISGTNVMTIYADNEIAITSTQAASTDSRRTVIGQSNLNWPENTQKGMGGDIGWNSNTSFIMRPGGVGFVRIKTAL